jgi:hypothetical protein
MYLIIRHFPIQYRQLLKIEIDNIHIFQKSQPLIFQNHHMQVRQVLYNHIMNIQLSRHKFQKR